MVSYIDDAIVLQNYDLGDYDRIYWLFTQKHGKVKAIAKGVRKVKAHQAGRLLLFNLVRLELAVGRNFDIIKSARTLDNLHAIFENDYAKFLAGGAVLQLSNWFTTQVKVRDTQQFELLLTTLRYFRSDEVPAQIAEIYARHLLKTQGYEIEEDQPLVPTLESVLDRQLHFFRELFLDSVH